MSLGEAIVRLCVPLRMERENSACVRRCLLFEPNAQFSDPSEYDMSGLLLEFTDATFEHVVVKNVIAQSPAGEAGIREGDEVKAVDGKRLPLEEVRALLRQPGKKVTLTIVRDGKEKKVPIVTRRLI